MRCEACEAVKRCTLRSSFVRGKSPDHDANGLRSLFLSCPKGQFGPAAAMKLVLRQGVVAPTAWPRPAQRGQSFNGPPGAVRRIAGSVAFCWWLTCFAVYRFHLGLTKICTQLPLAVSPSGPISTKAGSETPPVIQCV